MFTATKLQAERKLEKAGRVNMSNILFSSLFVLSLLSPLSGKCVDTKKIAPVANREAPVYTEKLTLRVLNSEDYIYLHDEEEGYTEKDLTEQFVDYAKEHGFENVTVVYDTSDTNETIYSELQTGKADYDVVNTSDYMAQKFVSEGLAYKLTAEDKEKIPNYFGEDAYASARLRETLGNIGIENSDEKLIDYAVGYTFGTLGILCNPSFKTFDENHRNISEDEITNDLRKWDALWDEKYKNTLTIKDSMRDTYAVGVLKAYEEELQGIQNKYFEDLENGVSDALETYQNDFTEIFNSCSQQDVDKVYGYLRSLKSNSFGLEVDSGKQDIVTGKIGLNLAWSGDAVYSMDQAEEETGDELVYAVPELGSNIWFDVWTIPANEKRSQAQLDLTLLWLNFLCDPAYASQNMDYTGYTPFIGGDDILDLTREWFDARTYYIYADEDLEVPVMYHDETLDEDVELDYTDFFEERTENEELFFYEENEEGEEEKVPFTDPNSEEEEPEQMHYNDLVAMLEDLEEVDLTYFFDGTLTEYEEEDMIFYSDCYLPFTYEDEKGNEQQNISVGRQFFAQFPNEETMNRCAVMRDYGSNNKIVMKMWEEFKSDPLPTWAVVLFITEGVCIVGGAAWFVTNKTIKRNIRHKRRETENE